MVTSAGDGLNTSTLYTFHQCRHEASLLFSAPSCRYRQQLQRLSKGSLMTTLHVLTGLEQPRLHLWRDKTVQGSAQLAYDVESSGLDANGLHAFTAMLDPQLHGNVNALVHAGTNWESNHHRKTLPRTAQYRFPDELWC